MRFYYQFFCLFLLQEKIDYGERNWQVNQQLVLPCSKPSLVNGKTSQVYLRHPESMRYHAGGVFTCRAQGKSLKYPVPHGRPVDLALNELQLIN